MYIYILYMCQALVLFKQKKKKSKELPHAETEKSLHYLYNLRIIAELKV